MGRMNQQPEALVHHFSHSHPLQLSHHQPQHALSVASCSGCKLEGSGSVYYCKPCNYFLHESCFQMPQQITHPFHQAHALSLLPNPAYPEGLFNCDACGKQGNGFSYHCKVCNFDLHILCASKPLFLTHPSHHHQLALSFSPPYPSKCFSCDICQQTGSFHWLYRCDLCGFDAHLSCATANPAAPSIQASVQQNFMSQFQTTSRASPHSHFPGSQTAMDQNHMKQFQTTPQPNLHCWVPTGQSYMQPFQTTPQATPPCQFPWSRFGDGQNHPPTNQIPVRPVSTSGPIHSLLRAAGGLVSDAAEQLGMNMVQGLLGGSGGGSSWGGGFSTGSYDNNGGADGASGSGDLGDLGDMTS